VFPWHRWHHFPVSLSQSWCHFETLPYTVGLFENFLRMAPFCIRTVTISVLQFLWHNLVEINEVIHEIGTISNHNFHYFNFASFCGSSSKTFCFMNLLRLIISVAINFKIFREIIVRSFTTLISRNFSIYVQHRVWKDEKFSTQCGNYSILLPQSLRKVS